MGTKSELLKKIKNQKFDLEERGHFGITEKSSSGVSESVAVSELLQVFELPVSIMKKKTLSQK